ncbi:hypothetical protein RvY_01344 [Ramazzottius varieornatus]|uniref:Uncharacterized protein n=1 Tax=Ramazzottius varieornatus TaxID=947166 RepID=A0A1D1UJK3_RAMVA|nr:hypothetical protein RvY_01344 [Ramazzottius varieornatus]
MNSTTAMRISKAATLQTATMTIVCVLKRLPDVGGGGGGTVSPVPSVADVIMVGVESMDGRTVELEELMVVTVEEGVPEVVLVELTPGAWDDSELEPGSGDGVEPGAGNLVDVVLGGTDVEEVKLELMVALVVDEVVQLIVLSVQSVIEGLVGEDEVVIGEVELEVPTESTVVESVLEMGDMVEMVEMLDGGASVEYLALVLETKHTSEVEMTG